MIFNPFWITLTEFLVVPGTSSTSPISTPDIYIYIYIYKLIYIYIYMCVYIYIYHHHQASQQAWISLTLSYHLSLSSIAPSTSSRQHPMSIQNCCGYILLALPTMACPCEGINRRTLFMSSSLLLQQSPACLVPLI